jgi:hypothetical protein
MAYHGYDPFHDIGSQDSTTLAIHTILLAAYNLDSGKFELYLSDIHGDGDTAFSTLKLCEGTNPYAAEALQRLSVGDSEHSNVGAVTLNSVIYPAVEVYQWTLAEDPLGGVTTFSILLEEFVVEETGVDFEGIMQFPHLDLGTLGREKQFVGLDLVADAPEGVTVSIGYNQRDLTKRTTAYAIDGDTLPAQMIPIPVTGPSFDLKIVFAANQMWEWQAACMYVQDWRITS